MKFVVLSILIISDFISKKIIVSYLDVNQFVTIMPYLKITHIHNYGISFGLFSNFLSSWIIILVGLIISTFLFFWLIKSNSLIEKWGILLILSGALGNIFDRIINNYVVDFIYMHYKSHYWPAYNLADIYITIGILLILMTTFKILKE
ncbi:MAG: Lipoprotein signal peptidase [Alphaproteobacteria bacterium MarineAlpha5_Bin9]|nr:MAG: Lipoprotein signal peptidase [Alphaproteobacteria bacterium MarineAlpha5_Bin9]|tara:strand:- start:17033 stop:17476 length:444 start_codon:yes stop_codon:yes gene_type:complete